MERPHRPGGRRRRMARGHRQVLGRGASNAVLHWPRGAAPGRARRAYAAHPAGHLGRNPDRPDGLFKQRRVAAEQRCADRLAAGRASDGAAARYRPRQARASSACRAAVRRLPPVPRRPSPVRVAGPPAREPACEIGARPVRCGDDGSCEGARRQCQVGENLEGAVFDQMKFLILAASIALTSTAAAQGWPTRPITLIVPFAPGGGVDVSARIQAQQMSELLGQPIVTENLGAAAGMVGSARVAKAEPDGYSFLMGNTGTHAFNQALYKQPLYHPLLDFTPLGLVSESPRILVARKDLPAGNLREFIAYAKANQTKMHFGSAGVGSGKHLAFPSVDHRL